MLIQGSFDTDYHYTSCLHQQQKHSVHGVQRIVQHFLTGYLGMVPTVKRSLCSLNVHLLKIKVEKFLTNR